MPLLAGTRLGSYEVVAPLGAGGMGEVYRARDTKLARDVAIKILPEAFVSDAERVARFEREAQLLAALNHPNIAAIYGLDESGATKFLVLELVEGHSLDAHLQTGALPLDEALALGAQILDALEVAHEKGIIHRDLKPANVMVTPEGQVKVLDFGLAKALEPVGRPELSQSPTLTFAATQAGVILGSAAYMSPEQAKGRAADKRSDVWGFGCVLYEMLAGRRAFDGEDVSDVLATVLKSEPDWSAFPSEVPPRVVDVIKRCLAKDRRQRIPDVSVIRFFLNEPLAAAPAVAVAVPSRKRSLARVVAGATTLALIAAAIGAGIMWWRTRSAPPQPVRFTLSPNAPPLAATVDRTVAITPDGRRLVYVVGATPETELIVRPIDQLETTSLRGLANPRWPTISPDGKWIAFFSSAGGDMKKVSIAGGPSIDLAQNQGPPRGAAWVGNDTIIFATASTATGLLSVPAGGGDTKVLTKPDPQHGESDHIFPSALPGGRAVLFTISSGTIENAQIAALDLQTGQRKVLVRGGTCAQYVNTGHLVYAAAGSLRAVRFDPVRLEVLSDPVPVVDAVSTKPTGAAEFAISTDGTLVYVPGHVIPTGQSGGELTGARSLVWVDRRGQEEPIKAPTRSYTYPRISPDGSRIALDIRDQENDIWIWDIAREGLRRLTLNAAAEILPLWSPDGKRIFFSSTRGANIPNLYVRAADGTGTDTRLATSPTAQFATSISPDGTQVVVRQTGPRGFDLDLLRFDRGAQITPLIHNGFSIPNAEISPDGRWLAYESLESNQPQIFVQPFPDINAGRWQVSTTGGTKPVWSRNGRELFFIGADGYLRAVPVQTATTFTYGTAVQLSNSRYFTAPVSRTYDVAPDGRFLMIKEPVGAPSATPTNIVVVLNWFQELQARVSGSR